MSAGTESSLDSAKQARAARVPELRGLAIQQGLNFGVLDGERCDGESQRYQASPLSVCTRRPMACIEPEQPLSGTVPALALQFAHALSQGLQFFFGVEEVRARPNVGVRPRDKADDELLGEELLGRLLRR